MKTSQKTAALSLVASSLLFLAGCNRIARFWYLSSYDRDIKSATKAIDGAHDNAHRAAAYTQRGRAYSEKARYSKAFKLISADEYDRTFALAIKDHDQAVALDPASAEAYYSRGRTYYDRAALETVVNGEPVGTDAARKAWFEPAVSDFKKAVERDSRLPQAWDMLGLSHETTGALDQAIDDYSQEMALNARLGRIRLADAYCARGNSDQKEKKPGAAIADYAKSIEIGATADGCSCDPYNPLFVLYTQSQRYDQAWAVVHQAQKSGKWIDPELLERLKQASGRGN